MQHDCDMWHKWPCATEVMQAPVSQTIILRANVILHINPPPTCQYHLVPSLITRTAFSAAAAAASASYFCVSCCRCCRRHTSSALRTVGGALGGHGGASGSSAGFKRTSCSKQTRQGGANHLSCNAPRGGSGSSSGSSASHTHADLPPLREGRLRVLSRLQGHQLQPTNC